MLIRRRSLARCAASYRSRRFLRRLVEVAHEVDAAQLTVGENFEAQLFLAPQYLFDVLVSRARSCSRSNRSRLRNC